MASLNSLLVSIFCILLTCLLAQIARRIAKTFVNQPFVRQLFLDAIAAAELCGCCFELIIVADNYGVSSYAVCLFLLTIWWSNQWEDATACPYTHLEDVAEGQCDVRIAFLRIWAELMGGIFIFRYIQILWSLELAPTHKNRAYEDCTADLQVPMLYGAIIEGIATCLCRLASRALGDLQPRFATMIDSFIGTSLVVAAFNYSGGYFNPVLATSLKYGCSGNTFTEHMVVYWLGAIAGSISSIYIYKQPVIQNLIFGTDKKKSQ